MQRNPVGAQHAPEGSDHRSGPGQMQRGGTSIPDLQRALLWVLNLSDGRHSLLDVAERSRMGFRSVRAAADVLVEHGLLAVPDSPA